MTLNGLPWGVPYFLTKVCFTKGETIPLRPPVPLIVFITEDGFSLSLEGEKMKNKKREEIIFLPQGFSYLFFSDRVQEIYLLPIFNPLPFQRKVNKPSFHRETSFSTDFFYSLPFHPLIRNFIHSILHYKRDEVLCEQLQKIKTAEFLLLLKFLYPEKELKRFFAPALIPAGQEK